jgi:hypothetical protein
MPSDDNTPGESERNVPIDENAVRKPGERALQKEAEAERLLEEWLAKQGYPNEPIDPVAQESLRRRIFAHVRQARDEREEWERVLAYEPAALNGIEEDLSVTQLGENEEEALLDQMLEKLEHSEPLDDRTIPALMHRVSSRTQPQAIAAEADETHRNDVAGPVSNLPADGGLS